MNTSRCFVAILGLALVASASAEDFYDLRGPAPEKGQIYLVNTKSVGKDMTRTIKFQGKTLDERFDEITTKKKQIEVLAAAGDEITRMRTKIVQDQREEISRKGGKKEFKRTTERDMQGQFIYSERTVKGWKNSLEDVSPTDKQKKELKEYVPFKEEDIFYPKEKVKVGHSWKIAPELFEKVLGQQFENLKGSGSAKFLRVDKKDGEEIAFLEIEFELTGKAKEDELQLDIKMKGKGTVERSLKHGFDRKSITAITTHMKGEGEIGGQKIEVEANGVTNTEDLVELKVRK